MYNINLNAYLINVIINLFWKQPLARPHHCVQKLAHPKKEEEEDNSGLLKDQEYKFVKT